jgi:outer membrane protein with beta-barrel domain
MKNVLGVITLVLAAAPAHAQTMQWQDRGFANVNILAQPQSRNVTVSSSFDLYDEPATVEGPRKIGGGAVFDVSGGYRVWRNLAVGLGYSYFADSSNVTATARIPDPLVFDQPVQQDLNAGKLDHSENAVHISAVWFWPVTDKIDVALSAGPSIFNVSDRGVSGVTVQPNTSIATGVITDKASETGIGINAGVDVTYLVTRKIGAGVLLRYAGSSVDLPTVQSLNVGGFQIGAGLRYRF